MEVVVGLVVGLYWAHSEKECHQRQALWEWPVGMVRHVHVELVFLALMQVRGAATMLWY
jgi:hypothetical protein